MSKMEMRQPECECSVCKANFYKTDVDNIGRCPKCVSDGIMPGTKQETDYIMSDKQKRENLKDLVREIMEEIRTEAKQEKLEAAYAAKKCKNCGEEFIPRAPAQQVCDSCRERPKELTEKKVEQLA